MGSLRKWNKLVMGRGAVGLVKFCGSEVLSVKIWNMHFIVHRYLLGGDLLEITLC